MEGDTYHRVLSWPGWVTIETILKGGLGWMEAGVRNKLSGRIEEIKTDEIMALVRMTVDG